jgi:hypothetical protein
VSSVTATSVRFEAIAASDTFRVAATGRGFPCGDVELDPIAPVGAVCWLWSRSDASVELLIKPSDVGQGVSQSSAIIAGRCVILVQAVGERSTGE